MVTSVSTLLQLIRSSAPEDRFHVARRVIDALLNVRHSDDSFRKSEILPLLLQAEVVKIAIVDENYRDFMISTTRFLCKSYDAREKPYLECDIEDCLWNLGKYPENASNDTFRFFCKQFAIAIEPIIVSTDNLSHIILPLNDDMRENYSGINIILDHVVEILLSKRKQNLYATATLVGQSTGTLPIGDFRTLFETIRRRAQQEKGDAFFIIAVGVYMSHSLYGTASDKLKEALDFEELTRPEK